MGKSCLSRCLILESIQHILMKLIIQCQYCILHTNLVHSLTSSILLNQVHTGDVGKFNLSPGNPLLYKA